MDCDDLGMSSVLEIASEFIAGESSGSSSIMVDAIVSEDRCLLENLVRDRKQLEAVQKQLIPLDTGKVWQKGGYFVELPSKDEDCGSVVKNSSDV